VGTRIRRSLLRMVALCALPILATCTEREVAAPVAPPEAPHGLAPVAGAELVVCEGSTITKIIRCSADDASGQPSGKPDHVSSRMSPAFGIAAGTKIMGSQGTYLQINSSNVAIVADTFGFDVTVQNLIPQPIGTTDGATADGDGVRVFFFQEPTVTGGSGNIEVANEDGTDAFTTAGQPYYQYGAAIGADGILSTNETSGSRPWKFRFDATVSTFTFKVYVSAAMQYPDGYIDVTPATSNVLTGNTQAATATVRKFDGTPTGNQTVTWATSDGAIATVDGSGVITGVAVGSTSITATQGALSGSKSISVCPNLAVGGVYTAVMPSASNICLGGAATTMEYTYMPINLSSVSSLSLSLTATGIQAVTGPPSPQVAEGASRLSPAFGGHGQVVEPTLGDYLHWQIQEENRHYQDKAQKIQVATRNGDVDQLIVPGVPAVNDLWNLNVAQGCAGARDDRVGRVVSISNHAIIVSDTANPPGGFTTAQYDSIALEFDSLAYAVDTTNFGGPTDLDTNQRAVVFYTRAVNELSPPASSQVTLGFFTARDLFSSAPASCPRSNEGEMFYMLVPDPTGVVNSNVRTVSFVRGSTVGTMAHELQHLINSSRRIYLNGTWSGQLEEVWLNEGLSHIAEELVFYRASVGLAPMGNIVVTQLTTGPDASRRVAAFNTYANQNYGRLRSWLQRPDTAGAFKNVDALATRGAIWAFLRYAVDRVNGTQSQFWYDLVNTQNIGTANLTAVIGADPNEWLRDFTTAMYSDDAVAGIASQYTQPSWSFRSLYTALNGSYQLAPRLLTNATTLTLSYSRGGGTAYARFGVPATGFATVTALSGGVPPTSPYSVAIIRTK
jgi:hypothetical protein